MPKIKKKINEIELGRLRQIYLKAETDIVNEIGRLRSLGNIDYHAVAALERIQRILRKMEDDSWEYIPKAIELQFYANHPEKAKRLESTSKHLQGYLNAETLTSEQMDVVFILANNLRDEIHNATERTETILRNTLTGKNDPVLKSLEVLPEREPPSIPVSALSNNLQYVPIGRREQDIYREISLKNVTLSAATGAGNRKTANEIYKELVQQGVTAFVDKSGRKWSLHSYCEMVTRTTDRQANVLAVLTAHTEHDLYIVSRSGSACPVCAPIEGRVFSKSGTNPYYPPLASIFGLVDPDGPEDLTNTWLNIHPNCVHSISEWDETGKSEKEIEKIRNFSSYETNPRTNDPRTQKQIEAYRRNQAARAKELRDYKQWEKYRMELGDDVPKTFQTFQKHKRAGDAKYQSWQNKYKQNNFMDESQKYALMKYVSSESYILNDALRNGWKLTNDQKKWIIDLDTALDKLPKYKGTVTRSVDFSSEEQTKAFADRYQIGKAITEKQYISTTKGEIYQPDAKVQLYIVNSTQGHDLGKFNQRENEILYKRNAKFKVLEKVQRDGVYHIELEEL